MSFRVPGSKIRELVRGIAVPWVFANVEPNPTHGSQSQLAHFKSNFKIQFYLAMSAHGKEYR